MKEQTRKNSVPLNLKAAVALVIPSRPRPEIDAAKEMHNRNLNLQMHTRNMNKSSGSTPPAHVETSPTTHSRLTSIMEICAAPKLDFLTVVKNNMKNRKLQLGFRLRAFWPPLLALGRLKTRL